MKVPLTWLRQYVELPLEPQAVAEMLAKLGFPVASIETRPVITGVIAGQIRTLEKHPNADRLQVGRVHVGDGAPLTIATAATNVAAGQTIAVATIGAQLPQLRIERRKMRGVESEGMMISAEELALPAEWFEDGIMQFDDELRPGIDVVEHFGLNEAVLDVEVTTNRADAMSVVGLARELAAYQGVPVRAADDAPVKATIDGSPPTVTLESPDCTRFVAQHFENVHAGVSPAWMRIRLALAGQRPINQLVDVSNYVMLEVGQPLHFYDAAKIRNHHLIVRDAHQGETIVALDGDKHELTPASLVIASEDRAECLAGLMGARSSEVTESTREILLESANFNGARIRRMSAQLGFRTEAGSRHEKGLPAALTDVGANRAARLLMSFGARAGATVAVGDVPERATIAFDSAEVKRLLGFDLSAQEISEYLARLGFAVEYDAHRLLVTPSRFRTDISCSADIVEEIARIAGYDRIMPEIPAVRPHEISSRDYRLQRKLRTTLAALGYHEIVTYSLHGAHIFNTLRKGGVEPPARPVEVQNPLSEEQRYLRGALEPAALSYLARVAKPMRIFEIGRVFHNEDHQPLEVSATLFGFSAAPLDEPKWRDSHFLRLKGDCEAFLRELTGRDIVESAPDERPGLHPGKTGVLLQQGREVAVLGQVHPLLQRAFGLELPVYLCTLRLENLPEYEIPQFRPPPKYPSTYRDLAIVCELQMPAQRIEQLIRRTLGALASDVRSFDEYRGPQLGENQKSLAVRITMQRSDATITDLEADAAIERVVNALERDLGVTLRR